jgi:hypothetical protein
LISTGCIEKITLWLAFVFLTIATVNAQQPQDGYTNTEVDHVEINDTLSTKATKKVHLPRKATIYSAVLPGLGQIYNRKYWKVPFVYGGFGALGYFVYWNQSRLELVTNGYFDISDKNPETKSYENIEEFKGRDWKNSSVLKDTQSVLRRSIDSYRRQRDLVIIGTVGFYLFNILDANVNAHLIDFDISEDLTMVMVPYSVDPITHFPVPGLSLTLKF